MEEGDCPPTSVCANQTRDALPSKNQVGKDNGCLTPIVSSAQEQRHAQAIKMFKGAMLKLSLTRNPSLSQSQQEMLAKRIDLCLPSLLQSPLHTPNHPPYALMIITALEKLNKKKGSKKVSISSFIRSNYQDLPLAHEHLLTHHLKNLVTRGEVIAVNKSLYALPGSNDYIEKRQQIVVGGETVQGEMSEDDIGAGALIALPAVVEPVAVDDSGGGLMFVCEKHAHDLTELKPMGGDDVNGSGLENSEAINEAVVSSQRNFPGCGCGRRPKKKIEDKQPQNRVDKVVGPVVINGFCGGSVSLSEKDPPTLTEPLSMGGDVVTCCGSKHSEAVPEAVVPLQEMLPRRSLRRLREKKIENEHQQNKIAEVLGRVYADEFDDRLMSLTEKHPSALIEHDSVNCDNDSSGGAKHLSAGIEEVESLSGLVRGSSPKHAFKDEKEHNNVVEGVEFLEEDECGGDSMFLFEKHPPSSVEQASVAGVGIGGGSKDSVVEAVETLPIEKIEVQQRQNEVADVVGPLDDNGDCGGGMHSPALDEVQSMGGDMHIDGGLKTSVAANEPMDMVQKTLPVRDQNKRHKRKRVDEQQQKEVINTSETILSMTIVDAANNDGEEDLAVENDSQKKQPGGRVRPPKEKSNRKQQEPIEEDLDVENASRGKKPGRRGRPPKKISRKQQKPVRAI